MAEEPETKGVENKGVEEDTAAEGGEGRRSAAATPPVGDDAVPGQTAVPAADDDVGVPSDDEMSRDNT